MSTCTACIPVTKVRFLQETLESVAAQVRPFDEVIIVDNMADGPIEPIVDRIPIPNVRMIRNDRRLQAVENWNRAVALAKTEWISIVCDDDVLLPSYWLSLQATCSGMLVDVVHGRLEIIDEKGDVIKRGSYCGVHESAAEFVYHRIVNSRPQFLSDFVFRKSALEKIGGIVAFEGGWFSDDATAFTLALRNGIGFCERLCFRYRHFTGTTSSMSGLERRMRAIRQYDEWLRSFLPCLRDAGADDDLTYFRLVELGLRDSLDRYAFQAMAAASVSNIARGMFGGALAGLPARVVVKGIAASIANQR